MAGHIRSAVIVLALTCAAASCGTGETSAPGDASPDGPADGSAVQGTVTVFAAASLTGTFSQLAAEFERANPGATVVLNLGASSALAQQILSGAPADVFAAASPATMATVTDAGGAGEATVIAGNTLQIAVPPGNPGGVTGLADLARPELTIALCDEQVPCGAAAEQVFERAGLTSAPDTLEQDVKAALSKVQLGEVDAALVYVTDVLAAGARVEGIAFPEAGAVVNDYPLAVLTDAPHPTGAAAFRSYVLSEEGQRVLVEAGFERP